MSWNYRLVKRTSKHDINEAVDVTFSVHSAYYHNEHETVPYMISAEPATLIGETVEELRADLDRMTQAFAKPMIDYETFDRKPVAPVVHKDWRD